MSSDEEDYRKMNRKAKRSVLPPPPDFDNTALNKEFAQKLLQERGFEITDEEFGIQKKKPQPKQSSYVPNINVASLKELMKEFQKSESIPNICTILKSILQSQEINQEQFIYYGVLRVEFLMRNKQFEDCKDLSVQLLQKNLNILQKTRVLVSYGRALMDTNKIYDALMQALRALSYQEKVKLHPIINLNSPYDLSPEQIYKEITDFFNQSLLKCQRDNKKMVQLLGVQGNSSTGCLGLGESNQSSELQYLSLLKNRQIISLACGEHHVIALVSGCSCINPFYINDCKLQDCNGGYEVFGWGENFLGQAVMDPGQGNFINTPQNLNQLSGKQIAGVSAYKCSSLAWNAKGEVFQWGVKFQEFQMKDILQVQLGQDFQVVLNKKKEGIQNVLMLKVYIQGSLISQVTNQPLLKFDKLTKIIEKPCQQIATGDFHLLALGDEGEVYGLGSNCFCQMGISQKDTTFLKQPAILGLEECFYVSASANSSIFVTTEGEVLYCGQITPSKIIDYPKGSQLTDECQIIQALSYDGQLYALNLKGKVYKWDPDNEPKFKEFMQGSIRQLHSARGVRVAHSNVLKGEWCRLEVEQEQFYTYEKIELIINLGDQFGPYGLKPYHPIRYNVFVLSKPTEDMKFQLEKCKEISRNKLIMQSENKIYINLAEGENISKLEVIQDDDPTKHLVSLILQTAGQYYIYIYLNDEILIDSPQQINVEVGAKEEELKQQQELEEARKKRDELEQKQLLIKKQQEEEAKKQKQLKQEQEQILKQNETKKRADEALVSHQQKQQQEKLQQDQERQLKKDALTGGGFDLSKIQPKQIIQKPQQQVQKIQQSIKQSSDLTEIKRRDFNIKTSSVAKSQPPVRVLNPIKVTPKENKDQFSTQQNFLGQSQGNFRKTEGSMRKQ
ncbi:hypothetical protein pb186bvf_004682 [Paramecium bursaria]